MSLTQTSFFSLEKYLAFERDADAKHEYLDGQVYDQFCRAATKASPLSAWRTCN
jgi:hypothetical protein